MIYEYSKATRIAWEKLKVEKKVVSLQPDINHRGT